ncbi:MAG TPA: aldehyde dehydrogenase family protein [Steroidobacteraceae bacterium]|nr:aldehyde dehydrogenase family protein [Steroidobacteraceae bacterium]
MVVVRTAAPSRRPFANPEYGACRLSAIHEDAAALSGAAARPFIDGALSTSASKETIDVINPSNGRPCLSLPVGSSIDVDRAVAAARRAYDEGRWSEQSPLQRKQVLLRLADLITREGPALDALDAEEMGKPVGESFANAAAAAALMRFYAEAVDKLAGDVYASGRKSLVVQRRVARGVVAAIVPWNFPTYVAVLKSAPALAAGNCVVLKPSELSTRSAARLGHLATAAGLPPGVLNVVPGLGATVGQALAHHMDVDMVTFTGSTAIGKLILQYAGQSNMKVVMSECGGKSPHVVFADGMNLQAVGDAIAQRLLCNQGQICSVGSRLLVERSIEKPLVQRIAERCAQVVIGDARDPATTFGPLASAKQHARVMRYIESAATEGAQLVCGGRRALPAQNGYFVEPTVFRDVLPSSRLAQEEVFGPVLAVTSFESEVEAVRLANSTPYGLAAYVWTNDLSRGMRMAKSIRSSVWINAAAPSDEGAGFATSCEPAGQSGIGVEGGLAGMEAYLRRQLIAVSHA